MKLSISNALYIAGGILLVSLLISQFQQRDLIFATLLTLSAPIILLVTYQKERKKIMACSTPKTSSRKWWLVVAMFAVVFLGFAFTMGKLVYLWSNL